MSLFSVVGGILIGFCLIQMKERRISWYLEAYYGFRSEDCLALKNKISFFRTKFFLNLNLQARSDNNLSSEDIAEAFDMMSTQARTSNKSYLNSEKEIVLISRRKKLKRNIHFLSKEPLIMITLLLFFWVVVLWTNDYLVG